MTKKTKTRLLYAAGDTIWLCGAAILMGLLFWIIWSELEEAAATKGADAMEITPERIDKVVKALERLQAEAMKGAKSAKSDYAEGYFRGEADAYEKAAEEIRVEFHGWVRN